MRVIAKKIIREFWNTHADALRLVY